MKKGIFWTSIAFNIIFILGYFWTTICNPSHELGKLKKDIEVGQFMGAKTIFKLPKGLTVSNEAERGLGAIGQFENNRFAIIITSDEDMIDYEISKDSLNENGNYYSAEFKKFLKE